MKVRIAREDTYIPKWRDNRKLPEKEQIKVYFEYMTAEQEERLSLVKPVYHGDEIELEVQLVSTKVWEECVKKIEGMFDEKDKPITAPASVLPIPHCYELITEVASYIRQNMDETEVKN